MSCITLVLPFNVDGIEAKRVLSSAWLFKIASHRLLGVVKQAPVLPATDIGWKNTFRSIVYEVVPNRRYADGVIVLVRGIYESCRQLGMDFREVELGKWLMFQQAEKEYPCRNITLKHGYEFHITTIDYNSRAERIRIKPTISKNYKLLLNKIIEEKQRYAGRVVVRDYGVRDSKIFVHGEIQLTIPLNFYYKHMTRYSKPKGNLIGGADVNTDRVNLAIIDSNGRLRDTKTFWFEEASRKGCCRRRARSIIGMRIHDMLKYAYHHGVSIIALENPRVLGRLKLAWVRNGRRLHRNYNWKKTVFRNRTIEMIALKAPLYGIKPVYIDPKGTTNSKEHDEVMKKNGLDKHTTSAYLIALKGLNKQPTNN